MCNSQTHRLAANSVEPPDDGLNSVEPPDASGSLECPDSQDSMHVPDTADSLECLGSPDSTHPPDAPDLLDNLDLADSLHPDVLHLNNPEYCDTVVWRSGPNLGSKQQTSTAQLNMRYYEALHVTHKKGLPVDISQIRNIAVGDCFPAILNRVDLMDIVVWHSAYESGLGKGFKLCHKLQTKYGINAKTALVDKIHFICARGHRGTRKPENLVHKKKEKKPSHKCECQFSLILQRNLKYEEEPQSCCPFWVVTCYNKHNSKCLNNFKTSKVDVEYVVIVVTSP